MGDVRRTDYHALETFCVVGPDVDHDTLMTFAEHVAAIAGKQAVIGETDDEFWFVDKPKAKKGKALDAYADQERHVRHRASDTFVADVWIDSGKVVALGTIPGWQGRSDDRRDGQVRHPRRHRRAHPPRHAVRRHQLESTTSRPARSRRRYGGTTTHRRLRHPAEGRAAARRGSTPGTRKAEGKAAIDYGFHMIMTDVNAGRSTEMERWSSTRA